MTEFSEIVNVTWQIEQPEGAVARLLALLNSLEQRLTSVASAASQAGRAVGGQGATILPAGSVPLGGGYSAHTTTQYKNPAGQWTSFSNIPAQYQPNVSRSGEMSDEAFLARFFPGQSRPSSISDADWQAMKRAYSAGGPARMMLGSMGEFQGGTPSPSYWEYISRPAGTTVGGIYGLGSGLPSRSGMGLVPYTGISTPPPATGGALPPFAGTGIVPSFSGGQPWWNIPPGTSSHQQVPLPSTPWGPGYQPGGYGAPPRPGGPYNPPTWPGGGGLPPTGAGGGAGGGVPLPPTGQYNAFNNAFSRHISWILQGIVIWGILRTTMDGTRAVLEEIMRMESAQARADFISGDTMGDVLTSATLSARYGINTQQAVPGIIAAGQLNSTPQQQQQARQLSLVFGADEYANALQELYQVQVRSNAVGLDHVQVMDFIASAYKSAPGNLETYFDALQQGIQLSQDLGLSAEQAGLAILNISKATEQTPETTATLLSSVIIRLRNEETQKNLKGYGIETATPSVMLRDIADEVDNLVSSGNVERARELLMELTSGLQAPGRALQLQVAFQELSRSFSQSNANLSDFNTLLENVGDTGQTAFQQLAAGVQVYFDSLILANAETGTFLERLLRIWAGGPEAIAVIYSGLEDLARGAGGMLNAQALIVQYEAETGQSAYRDVTPRGGGGRGGRGPNPNGPEALMTDEFYAWLRAQEGTISGADSQSNAAWAARMQGLAGFYNPPQKGLPAIPPPPEFGGFQNLPEGADWDEFRASVRKYEQMIQEQVPAYELDRREVAFYDEATDSYRTMIADLNAIRFATDEQRKLMQQQITGVFNVPAGGEALVAFFALTQGFIPDYLSPGRGASDIGAAGEAEREKSTAVSRSTAGPRTGGRKVSGRINPIIFDRDDLDRDLGIMSDMPRGSGNALSRSDRAWAERYTRQAEAYQSGRLGSMNVTNNIRVILDSRVIAMYINRQNYRDFNRVRNSSSSPPNSQALT